MTAVVMVSETMPKVAAEGGVGEAVGVAAADEEGSHVLLHRCWPSGENGIVPG